MDMLLTGLNEVFTFSTIMVLLISVPIGIFVGSLPGLTATMGVALLLPVTFGLSPVPAILLLIGVYFGAIYGGSISAILLRTPGTPAAAATTLDGYPLAQQGMAKKALTVSTLSSAIGGFISVIILILLAPELAKVALKFGPPEVFALAVFGLSIVSSIAGKSMVKGLAVGVVGLIIATIGLDPVSGYPRFTFGSVRLMGGIEFLPVMIGLFAAAEVYRIIEGITIKEQVTTTFNKVNLTLREFRGILLTILRSTGIGTFIGMIPGAGGDICAFVAYNETKRVSKNKDEFGKGSLKGIAAPEAANNASTGGAQIPLLTLGIPGDAVTAVLLGAFMVQGLQPGPMLFQESGEIVYALFIGMLIANLLIIVYGLLGIRLFMKVLHIPKAVLVPIILVFSIVGSYALGNNFFDVWVMFISGVIGYFMLRYDYPAAPIILAMILGPMAESNLRRSLVLSQGSYEIFLTRPITLIFLSVAVLTLCTPIIKAMLMEKQ